MYADIVLCLDSTRKLYEKKLEEAMAKNTKLSSDKTYYREERNSIIVIKCTVLKDHIPVLVDLFFLFFTEEEVTYVTYRQPVSLNSSIFGYSCIALHVIFVHESNLCHIFSCRCDMKTLETCKLIVYTLYIHTYILYTV